MRKLIQTTAMAALSLFMVVPQAPAQIADDEMFAPLPAAANGPAIDQSVGYLVQELGRGLYMVSDGIYQMMFLTTGEGVIAVDAPPNMGQKILPAIASVTDEPVTHVIYSHTHQDHIGAATIYPEDAVIIAHEDATAHLVAKGDPARPVPTQSFSDAMTLTVGSQTLQLDYRGVNHLEGNIYIYAPEQKVLMLVDVVFPGWTPFPDLAIAASVDGFLEAHDIILSYDFDHFIGGHLTRHGNRADVETQKAYFDDIISAATKANAAADMGAAFGAAAARGGMGNPWAFIKIVLDNVAGQCAAEVEEKWGDRLGGVDIFTFDHCWIIAEHLNVD